MIRELDELERNAFKFWPKAIAEKERNLSIIPKLIETQDKFFSLLDIADAEPFAWKSALSNSRNLPANLFLKHLMVLSDIGGEKLERFKTELPKVFRHGVMEFYWNGNNYHYAFKTLSGSKTWSNKYLKVDGTGLLKSETLTPMMEDAINLILFGGFAIADNIPDDVLERCIIGSFIGNKQELDLFVRQRYIWVSRITGGATANSLGNLAQKYVIDFLRERLLNWNLNKKQIPGITQNENTYTSFDIVAESPKGKYCAIEVSFQVTTNSTIERKAGQAKSRQEVLNVAGHKIAYVVDGAGNFKRSAALTTICQFSDYVVTFKEDELEKLSNFLLNWDKEHYASE